MGKDVVEPPGATLQEDEQVLDRTDFSGNTFAPQEESPNGDGGSPDPGGQASDQQDRRRGWRRWWWGRDCYRDARTLDIPRCVDRPGIDRVGSLSQRERA